MQVSPSHTPCLPCAYLQLLTKTNITPLSRSHAPKRHACKAFSRQHALSPHRPLGGSAVEVALQFPVSTYCS